ncbi:hypothetical protein CA54_53880 [Symmachiella macrocystis]|uniref:Uncharacterized protein n=1 Tax=Symmachiella macrocystis TaxID=2527985 RepID=A0A5C6B8Y8_9PLAN|nr:PEP-CTERM sorting domain-containing protein [Symmachiella macrocystis]TWU06984.1 hypothetical protein CA54_53880 [Symmachiella macrocystis]
MFNKRLTHRSLMLTKLFAISVVLPSAAHAEFSQGFETDTSGWSDGGGAYGVITRVASGTGGITSADGGYHATVEQTTYGVYTAFDGYRSTWPGNWTTSVDIYLDIGWAAGEGFDYSVAANGSDGAHERDFIFHVTKDTSTGDLLVGASNNTNFDPREDLETLNHAVIGSSGWYTFEHSFQDVGGVLSVDLNLYDGGGLIWTETRSNPADLIPSIVGGNRYGWFTNVDIAGGIAVDNTALVPEPSNIAMLLGLSAFSLAGYGWRRKKQQAA